MTLHQQLESVIRDRYACAAAHRETVPVREERAGRILWEGRVEVFHLRGHQRARRCYAWQEINDAGEPRYITILETGHVDSPRAAVRAAMVDESRRQGP